MKSDHIDVQATFDILFVHTATSKKLALWSSGYGLEAPCIYRGKVRGTMLSATLAKRRVISWKDGWRAEYGGTANSLLPQRGYPCDHPATP